MKLPLPLLTGCILISCIADTNSINPQLNSIVPEQPDSVYKIPLPAGYKRVEYSENSFGGWLRNLHLKKNKTVYLYNGVPKRRQHAQFAVLDISVGKKDLQQCADAVIRLRAEFLFSNKKYNEITFKDNAGKEYNYQYQNNRNEFDKYLEIVFGWCGSASLEKQLMPVKKLNTIEAGDVFIKGGFPGHAMIVMDVAVNNAGKKIYLLAQSYMPAQDIHIVKNPMNPELSPWYEVNEEDEIQTPEWLFYINQLRKWEIK